MSSRELNVTKGHGTGNDFVIILDSSNELRLSERDYRWLADRNLGVGADGVIRVVRTDSHDETRAYLDAEPNAEWFMDYRNSDGSIAEMCGNGARVFAKYLRDTGLVDVSDFVIGTRGGPRKVHIGPNGLVSIEMGSVQVAAADSAQVSLAGQTWPATPATAPNPHAVAFVTSLSELDDIEASLVAPESAFPEGANIEFVEVISPTSIAMEVNERGSGRTLSCGTGACAAAAVHRQAAAASSETITVSVAGGEVSVEFRGAETWLTGPAEIVARGELDQAWWASR